MLSSSTTSDIGIGASSRENNSCISNSHEPIISNVLLNMTSVSTVMDAPMLIRFLIVAPMVITELLNLSWEPWDNLFFLEQSRHSQIQLPVFQIKC